MDFTLDEEQTLAAQSLRELLVDQCTGTDLRRAAEAPDAAAFAAACATRAAALAGLGLAGALVPESQGGLGLQPVDLVAIAVEAGHAALPEPLLESAGVAMPLLAALAAAQPAAAAVLERALAGEALVLALAPGDAQLAALGAADFVLTGRDDTELVLHARGALSIRALASVDPLRRLGGLDAASIASEPLAALRGAAAEAAWRAARARGATLVAAEQLGLATRMVGIAVTYASERRQFGRAIGSNQAVKHQLANVQLRIEFARPVVFAAAAALAGSGPAGSGPPVAAAPSARTEVRVSHAALAAAEAADLAARTAIQVHGAMGYSWELDLQFYAKRAWALAGCHGGRAFHARRVHDALRGGTIPLGPDALFED